MGERVLIADLKRYAVWKYMMSNGIEGWDEEEVYASSPEEAWRKVYRRWGEDWTPDLEKVRELK